MFDILNSLTKATVSVVSLPVTAVADVVTLGGTLTDKEQPYTAKALEDLVKNLEQAADPKK